MVLFSLPIRKNHHLLYQKRKHIDALRKNHFYVQKRSIGFSMLFAKVNVFLKVVGGAKISTIFAPRSFQVFHVICFFDVHCTLTKMEHEFFLLAFYSEPIFCEIIH